MSDGSTPSESGLLGGVGLESQNRDQEKRQETHEGGNHGEVERPHRRVEDWPESRTLAQPTFLFSSREPEATWR